METRRCRHLIPLKLWQPLVRLYGVMTQETTIWIKLSWFPLIFFPLSYLLSVLFLSCCFVSNFYSHFIFSSSRFFSVTLSSHPFRSSLRLLLDVSLPLVGCAIAQKVSRRLLTSAEQVRSYVRSCGFVMDRVELGFLLPILIPPNASYLSIVRGWYVSSISVRLTNWPVWPHAT
jgi:hypothetical protein